jgi:hypothetical protein
MDYSITNIYNLWQQYLLPGRFVPLSDLSVYAYAFVGHKFMQVTQAPLNYFDAITKLILIGLLYVAIRTLFQEISKGSVAAVPSKLSQMYPIGLFIIWGLGANIFWDMNGVVAYPFMIYTPFVVCILFVIAVLRNLRKLADDNRVFNNATLILMLLATLWANFYYEIAYMTFAAIVVAILVAPISNLTNQARIKLSGMFIAAFLIIWIPMRWILSVQCQANLDVCYVGSQLNLGGMFETLLMNIVNPLPFTDYDALTDFRNGRLPFVLSGLVLVAALFFALIVISNLRSVETVAKGTTKQPEGLMDLWSAQWRLTAILLAMGGTCAVIMSVSLRAQELVDWGLAYRHTPMLWMGYAALILLGITWLTMRTSAVVGGVALVLVVVLLVSGQWGRSWLAVRDYNEDFQPVSRLYLELYNADLEDSELANTRRCLIIEELSGYYRNQIRYIEPAEEFMNTFHDIDFCKS